VVDAKNWTGEVQIHNGVLRQNRYSREREVSGVFEQCAAIAALLEPQHRRYVQAWLCMVGQPTLHGVTANGARIQGIDTLRSAVSALPAVLDTVTVETIHNYLKGLLSGHASPSLLTTRSLTAGVPDLTHSSGPGASLENWRNARHANTVKLPTTGKPKGRKSKGCLGALFQLSAIVVVLCIFLTAWPHLSQQTSQSPRPTPSVVRTVPPL
jgi:hypothetical protein